MKSLADAFSLRNRMIEILERADLEEDPDEQRAQLTFVVGGGGFSGVETAGEVEDFIRRVRRRLLPEDQRRRLQRPHGGAQDQVLPEMRRTMGDYARPAAGAARLRGATGMPLKEVRENGVVIGEGDEFIPARTVMWTGGVQPSPVVARRASGSIVPDGRSSSPRWRRAAAACGRSATARSSRRSRRKGRPTRRPPRTRSARRSGLARNIVARSTAVMPGRAIPLRVIGHPRLHRPSHRGREGVRDPRAWLDRVVHVARLLLEPRSRHRPQGAYRARLDAPCHLRLRSDAAQGRLPARAGRNGAVGHTTPSPALGRPARLSLARLSVDVTRRAAPVRAPDAKHGEGRVAAAGGKGASRPERRTPSGATPSGPGAGGRDSAAASGSEPPSSPLPLALRASASNGARACRGRCTSASVVAAIALGVLVGFRYLQRRASISRS